MNEALENLSRWVAPNQQRLQAVNHVTDRVIRAIQGNGERIGVDRVIISGSMGKKTSLDMKFDVDLVVFVNDIEPPFGETIDRIDDLLCLNFDDNKYIGFPADFCLKCTVEGVKFDILMATNLAKNGIRSSANTGREQRKGLLDKFSGPESCYKDIRPYSAAFCETTCDFLSSRPEKVHSAIRLGKLWLSTLVWFDDKKRRSLSYATELLFCQTFETLSQSLGEEPGMQQMFEAFLRQLVDWRSLRTIWTLYYAEDQIPLKSVEISCPLILDPANPWNNVAHGLPWVELEGFASTTLRRLEVPGISICDLLAVQFDPQGLCIIQQRLSDASVTITNELVSTSSLGMMDFFPHAVPNQGEMKESLLTLANDILHMAVIAITMGIFVGTSSPRDAVANALTNVRETVFSLPYIPWRSLFGERHDMRDITLRIPIFHANGSTETILCSFSFNNKNNIA